MYTLTGYICPQKTAAGGTKWVEIMNAKMRAYLRN